MRPKRLRASRPNFDRLEGRCLLSAVPQGLSPAQLKAAYGLNNLAFSIAGGPFPADGTAQTIALIEVDHDPYLLTDLTKFDSTFGLPTPAFYGQNQPGAPWLDQFNLAGGATDPGWAEEETLDVEWAHAMAPGANLMVIEAASGSTSDLLHAIAEARATPGVTVVSMSWGVAEFPGESSYDVDFTTPPGHAGITFIAASGDTPGVEWPAASPEVLSVGGTTLNTSAGTAAYLNEAAWGSSGGGISLYEAEPVYQYNFQSTGRRSVPDVAFDGNPNTGVSVYTTNPRTGAGSWSVFGGTSLGSPAWAGIMAIINEGVALAHIAPSMDGYTQALPILYSRPTSAFRPVYSATYSGAAAITKVGRGTPNGVATINFMLGYSISAYNLPSSGSASAAIAAPTAARSASTATIPGVTPAIVAATVGSTVPDGPAFGGATPVPVADRASVGSRPILVARPALAAAASSLSNSTTPGAGPNADGAPTTPASPTVIVPVVVLAPDPAPAATPPPATGSDAPSIAPGDVVPAPALSASAPVLAIGLVTLAPLQAAPPLDHFGEALRSREDEDSGIA